MITVLFSMEPRSNGRNSGSELRRRLLWERREASTIVVTENEAKTGMPLARYGAVIRLLLLAEHNISSPRLPIANPSRSCAQDCCEGCLRLCSVDVFRCAHDRYTWA